MEVVNHQVIHEQNVIFGTEPLDQEKKEVNK